MKCVTGDSVPIIVSELLTIADRVREREREGEKERLDEIKADEVGNE